MYFRKQHSLWIGKSTLFQSYRDVRLVMNTRKGGVSRGAYHALNLGINTYDDPESIQKNIDLFLNSLQIAKTALAIPNQIHGDNIVEVSAAGNYPQTDAIITRLPSIFLVIQTADCVPVALYCPQSKSIGLVHAGWKGTVHSIAQKTVMQMQKSFKANPQKMIAFIGPSIGPCCFEVGDEVKQEFNINYQQQNNIDLWQCNFDQLIASGLTPQNIEMSHLCTKCHQNFFFSHRGSEGKTGRMWSVLGMRS